MERLTERTAAGVANINYSGCYFDDGMRDIIAESARRQTAIERLASIEDILGEDYDLDRLREIVEADNDKRCVIFEKGYGIVSLYEKDDEGFVIRTVSGVVTREEYDRVLIGGNNEKVLKPRRFAPAD